MKKFLVAGLVIGGCAIVTSAAKFIEAGREAAQNEAYARAVLKADPTMAPTAGQVINVDDQPYYLRIGPDPFNKDCDRISLWQGAQRPEDNQTGAPPVYESASCG